MLQPPKEEKEGDIRWMGNSFHFLCKRQSVLSAITGSVLFLTLLMLAMITPAFPFIIGFIVVVLTLILYTISFAMWQSWRNTPFRVGISDLGFHYEHEEGVLVDPDLRFNRWDDIVTVEPDKRHRGNWILVRKDGARLLLECLDRTIQLQMVNEVKKRLKN